MKAKSGRVLSQDDLDALAKRAEKGFDLGAWRPRRGRPPLSASAAEHSPRIAVRVPEELRSRVRQRAGTEGRSLSEVVRDLLEAYASGPPSPIAAPGGRSSQEILREHRDQR